MANNAGNPFDLEIKQQRNNLQPEPTPKPSPRPTIQPVIIPTEQLTKIMVPNTGDTNAWLLWLSLMGMSCLLNAIALTILKKQKQ